MSTANALAILPPAATALDAGSAVGRLVDAFLAGRSPQTLRAYRADLADFAHFAGVPSVEAIPSVLLTAGQGGANELALCYRAHLARERGLAPATVNRRLAALRSLVKLARTIGVVPWSLDVEGVRAESYRDTRGPGKEGFTKLLEALAGRQDAKGLRDRALIRLLFDLGLRRAEACRLDAEDLDERAGTVAVLGKGRAQKVRLTLPEPTRAALAAWLDVRGRQAGPLLVSLDRARKGDGRLSGSAVWQIVRQLGRAAGVGVVRPHGLRHAAITAALDVTKGDVRAVQRFSRHKNLQTLLRYDDARQDLAGDVARKVAEAA